MKESARICKYTCVGLLCVLSCIDSTFYNRRHRFSKQSTVINNATNQKQSFRQNNKRTRTNDPLTDTFLKEPFFDKLQQKYLRQLEREFIGRGPHPLTDVTPSVRNQPKRKIVDRTFLSSNRKRKSNFSSNIYQNNFQNGFSLSGGGRSSFRPNHQNFPKGARYVKKPIITQPRRPQPRIPPHQHLPDALHHHHHQDSILHDHFPFGLHHHWIPERLGRRPIANCDFQNDMDVTQLFPGLFRTEGDIMEQQDMKIVPGKRRPHMKVKEFPKVLWCAEDEKTAKEREQPQPHNLSFLEPQLSVGNRIAAAQTVETKTIDSADPILSQRNSLRRGRRPIRPCNPRCCRQLTGYAPITEVEVKNVTYYAVNTTELNQYLPVGVCPTNACSRGRCIQHNLSHWVLIWNNSLPYWPPLQFTRMSLPGYCTWENVQLN